MAVTTFSELPPTLSLNGSELVCISQFDPLLGIWSTYTTTTAAISEFFSGISVATPSMRQIKAAMAQQSVLVDVDNSVPADITNSYSIAWTTAFRMSITDQFVTGFLVPLLGQSEVNTIFALAPSFPI